MKRNLALALSVLILSVAGCEKHGAEPEEVAVAGAPNQMGASRVAEAAFASADRVATAAKPAEAPADEKMSCGDGEKTGESCDGTGEGCSKWDAEATRVAKREVPADAVWATIPVQGMTCGGCERRVIANLGGVEGILGVEADAELGQVRIAFAKGNDGIAAAARSHIAKLGYKPN